MTSADQQLLLDLFCEENVEGVRYHQDGVILKGNAQDDKRNFTGSLLIVQRYPVHQHCHRGTSANSSESPHHPSAITAATSPSKCFVVWIPYSYLFCLAPHLVSPIVRRSIDADGDLPLLDRHDAVAHLSTRIEWMYTVCIPLSRVARLQRKSNLRGKRIVTIFRVGGGLECPMIFQEGGMSKFFDELKKICVVRQAGNSTDEFVIEDPSAAASHSGGTNTSASAGNEGDGAELPAQQPTKSAGHHTRMFVSASAASQPVASSSSSPSSATNGGTPAYVDPQDFRRELYGGGRQSPAAATAASSSSPGSLAGAVVGPLSPQTGPPASAAADPRKKSVMGTLLSFGAQLTQRGTKIAGSVMNTVASVADDLVRQDDNESSGNFEVVEPIASVEDLVPKVSHLIRAQRKQLKPRLSKAEWDLCLAGSRERRLDAPTFQRLREKAFGGGIEESVRGEMWSYLLKLYPVGSTATEREVIDARLKNEYEVMRLQWKSMLPEQIARHSGFRERRGAIEKDVIRTDRFLPEFAEDNAPKLQQLHDVLMTYATYNFDLGYCQGMSDILAMIALLYDEDWKVFAMFRALMSEKCEGNFRSDVKQNMEKQLLAVEVLTRRFAPDVYLHLERHLAQGMMFCFRWLLILFKREFELKEAYLLWDVLFSAFTPQYEVLVTAALVKALGAQIREQSLTYDELLKFANRISGNVTAVEVILLTQEYYEVIVEQLRWQMESGMGSSKVTAAGGEASPISVKQRPTLDEILKLIQLTSTPPSSPAIAGAPSGR